MLGKRLLRRAERKKPNAYADEGQARIRIVATAGFAVSAGFSCRIFLAPGSAVAVNSGRVDGRRPRPSIGLGSTFRSVWSCTQVQ